jgi:hypothetical protein
MLPSRLDPATASPGEQDVFKRLQDDPATADWIVLHSLDIAHHIRAVSGELDFLVLVPGKGALALEVKACRTLRREDGLWFYGGQERGDPRGPFKQASQGMHSVRKVVERHPDLGRVMFFSAVLFPYVPFKDQSDEWHSWQAIDNRQFSAAPLSSLILGVLESARAFLATRPGARWFNPGACEPTRRQCEVISHLLRPNFETVQSPSQRRQERDHELRTFTEEQFAALDAMAANQRVLFEGAAGTGKTFLALEEAFRSARSGKRVLLLCFNTMLAAWLRDQAHQLDPSITTKTIHAYMLQISRQDTPGTGRRYWEDDLPACALERLVEDESFIPFDEIIVDEAQDILRESYLDVLDLSLRGGLAAGAWRLFGDFERQALYGAADVSAEQFCSARGGSPSRFRLATNCRNTPRIVELTRLLCGLGDTYARVLRPDTGIEPSVRFVGSEDSAPTELAEILDELYRDGLRGSDIAVLSPLADGCCAARVMQAPWASRLVPARDAGADEIPYATVHAFKGLEAAAIVITDINSITGSAAENLLYTAMTRATDRLIVLAAEPVRHEMRQILAAPPVAGMAR